MSRPQKTRPTIFRALSYLCPTLSLVIVLGVFAGAGSAVSACRTPVSKSLPKISGTPRVGKTLTATNGVWSSNVSSHTRWWERCGKSGGSCSKIKGAGGLKYKLTSADIGHTIRVEVTAHAGACKWSAVSIATAVITRATSRSI